MDELRPCDKHRHVHPRGNTFDLPLDHVGPELLYWDAGCGKCQEATLCSACECIVDGWKTKPEDRDLKCLLPVVRQRYNEETDERESYIDACGAELFLISSVQSQLQVGGPMEINNPWEVKCLGDHVLFTPDDEGNDHDIPFVFEEFVRAYKHIENLIYPPMYLIAGRTVHDE